MNLTQYIDEIGIRPADLARSIRVSDALLYQWTRHLRPVAIKHCVAIESVTDGKVTRKDLRPDDWQTIWPELIDTDFVIVEGKPIDGAVVREAINGLRIPITDTRKMRE